MNQTVSRILDFSQAHLNKGVPLSTPRTQRRRDYESQSEDEKEFDEADSDESSELEKESGSQASSKQDDSSGGQTPENDNQLQSREDVDNLSDSETRQHL
jgi:hypothetical protein